MSLGNKENPIYKLQKEDEESIINRINIIKEKLAQIAIMGDLEAVNKFNKELEKIEGDLAEVSGKTLEAKNMPLLNIALKTLELKIENHMKQLKEMQEANIFREELFEKQLSKAVEEGKSWDELREIIELEKNDNHLMLKKNIIDEIIARYVEKKIEICLNFGEDVDFAKIIRFVRREKNERSD